MHHRTRAHALWPRIVPLALLLLAAGCTAPSSERGEESGEVPPVAEESAPEHEKPLEEPDEPAAAVTLYFIRSGDDRLWIEPETHWITGTTEPDTLEVFRAMADTTPHDPGLSTEVPTDLEVLAVTLDGDIATIDVGLSITNHSTGSAGEIAFAEQLAHTARHLTGANAIRLTINGEPADELWGHLDWSQPYEADMFALTPITIDTPIHGATVPAGEVAFAGQATVFEATFMVRLLDAAGTVLEEEPVMASTGAPERGSWTISFTIVQPGEYVLEAEEDDPSGGEGRPPLVIQRQFVVVDSTS